MDFTKLIFVLCLCGLIYGHSDPPQPYEVTMHNGPYPNYWPNSTEFLESRIHGDDELYEPLCVTDKRKSVKMFDKCTFIDLRREPEPPFARSRLVINEINTDNPGDDHNNLFIELAELVLQTETKRPRSLRGFKLILVNGARETIDLVINLKDKLLPDFLTDTKRFFVVGTESVEKVDVTFTDNAVQSVFNNEENLYKLPVGDESPYAVILLFSRAALALKDIKLTKNVYNNKWEPLLMNDEIMSTIRQYSQDQVVYGRKVDTNRCDIFEKLWFDPTILNPKKRYLTRDWDQSQTGTRDWSLSRCSSLSKPFAPEFFKYAPPSPGMENFCDNSFHFVLEDNIDELTKELPEEVLTPSATPKRCSSDQIDIPNLRYQEIHEPSYHKAKEDAHNRAKRACLQDDSPATSFAQEDMDVDLNNELLIQGGENPIVPPYDKSKFKPSWVELAEPFLPKDSNILENPEYQSWLRISSSPENPVRFSCEVCSTMIDHHFMIQRNKKKDIMTEKGYFSDNKSKNKIEIVGHMNEDVHLMASAYLREIYAEKTHQLTMEMINKEESAASKLLLPTISMVRTVFMVSSASIAFTKHEDIVNLQKVNGVNLGKHHYHRRAAEEITTVIGDMFHDILLDHLVKNDKEFSIIVDTTTDTRNIPYMTVHFQTMEGNRPVVYFYRLIVLDEGESAAAMKSSLWKKIREDTTQQRDFEGFVNRRLISYVSDGASNMVGVRSSLWVLIRQEIGRFIPSIICMAHKLENAIKRGIERSNDTDLQYFALYNKSINKLYVFYSSRGSKKWAHFEQTAAEVGIRPTRMKYFFEIRWASSHFICLENIYKNYKALVKDTNDISADTTFTKRGRDEATLLYLKLVNKSCVMVLHEFLDILGVYKQVSLSLQSNAGTLPGKAGIIKDAVAKLEALKSNHGAYVKRLLSKVSCEDIPCEKGTCTVSDYERCESVIYDDDAEDPLTDNDIEIIHLSTKRHELYKSLIDGINHYFNIQDLEHFEIFNQKRLLTTGYQPNFCVKDTSGNFTVMHGSMDTFPNEQPSLEYLGRFYGMSVTEISEMKTGTH